MSSTEHPGATAPGGAAAPRRRSPAATTLGIAVLLLAALVLWCSVLSLDEFPLLAQLSAFRVQEMAGLLVLGAAFATRRGRARTFGIALVVLALSPLPQIVPRVVPDGPTGGSGQLTVLSVNVRTDDAGPAAVAALAVARGADVVALPEASAEFATAVATQARAGGLDLLAATDDPVAAAGAGGSGRGTPYPTSLLVRSDREPVFHPGRPAGRLGAVTAEVRSGGRVITVAAVHPSPPVPGLEAAWVVDHEFVAELCATGTPTILAGDFNSTLDQSPMRAGLAAGCEDAAEATGNGLRGTWPASWPWPLRIPIDHVLITPDAGTVTRFDVVDVDGTDHRGVVAVIATPPRPAG